MPLNVDTVKISGDGWLLNGSIIVPNDSENAHCVLVQKWLDSGNTPEPELSNEELLEQHALAVRVKRDSLISSFSWRYERYASELRLGIETTDSIELLDQYAQALRDITDQEYFPSVIDWPVFEGAN
jgi:hypothetical protein